MGLVNLGRSHSAKKQLFQRGLRRGFLTIQEIETALPPGSLTAAERWLLYYSLRAAEIELRDEGGNLVTVPPLSPEELERLQAERSAPPPPEPPDQLPDELSSDEAERGEDALAALDEGAAEHH
jgi:hypothetical protein